MAVTPATPIRIYSLPKYFLGYQESKSVQDTHTQPQAVPRSTEACILLMTSTAAQDHFPPHKKVDRTAQRRRRQRH